MNKVKIASGVYQSWAENKQIVVFHLQNVSRLSVDAYIDANVKILNSWDTSQPYLCMQEITPQAIITPYLHRRVSQIEDYINSEKFFGRIAITIYQKFFRFILQTGLNNIGVRTPAIEKQLFSDFQQALKWLRAFKS